MLAYVKKIHRHSDELLHLALILSLIRVDPESYLGLGFGRSNVNRGNGHNITMGETWAHASSDFHHGFPSHLPDIPYLHPKSMEASLTQYQEELIEDLNDLGRYTNVLPHRRTITAYLLDNSSLGHDPSMSNTNNVSPVVATSSSSLLENPQHDLNNTQPPQHSEDSLTQEDGSDLSMEVTSHLEMSETVLISSHFVISRVCDDLCKSRSTLQSNYCEFFSFDRLNYFISCLMFVLIWTTGCRSDRDIVETRHRHWSPPRSFSFSGRRSR